MSYSCWPFTRRMHYITIPNWQAINLIIIDKPNYSYYPFQKILYEKHYHSGFFYDRFKQLPTVNTEVHEKKPRLVTGIWTHAGPYLSEPIPMPLGKHLHTVNKKKCKQWPMQSWESSKCFAIKVYFYFKIHNLHCLINNIVKGKINTKRSVRSIIYTYKDCAKVTSHYEEISLIYTYFTFHYLWIILNAQIIYNSRHIYLSKI